MLITVYRAALSTILLFIIDSPVLLFSSFLSSLPGRSSENLSTSLSLLSDSWHHTSLLDHQFSLELHATRIGLSAPFVSFLLAALFATKMCSVVLVLLLVVLASAIEEQLYEGSPCPLESGDTGICKKLPECTPRLKEVQEGKRQLDSLGRCGFDGFIEIVCCPLLNVTDKISPRLADVACQEYLDARRYDLSFHIYGGTEAKPGEFPYVVALGYEDNAGLKNLSSISYNCGGSLISVEHVLTAAHCVNNINKKVPIEVRLGNESIDSNATNVQRIPISDIIWHPKYKRSASYNDVAILKLKTKVLLSSLVQPVCLQTQSLNPLTITPKMSLIVIGWGGTDFGESSSTKLMRTPDLRIVDKEECAKHYEGFRKLPFGIGDSMICAVDANRTRGSDACQGDSGGPLLLFTEKGVKVIGITAFGQGCGGPVPGVYTMVYSYLDWIEEQVWTGNRESKEILKTQFINPIINITITRQ